MNNNGFLYRIPIPICGLALGIIGLGNLLKTYSEDVAVVLAYISIFILLLFVIRCVVYPSLLREDLSTQPTAAIAGTFSMTLMLFCGYIPANIGKILIIIAVAIHILIILNFTIRFVRKMRVNDVIPAMYVTYVGIAAAAITGPKTGLDFSILVWFGLICAVILTICIFIRLIHKSEFPNPILPTVCILPAPFSLCLVGYSSSIGIDQIEFLTIMCAASIILFVIAATYLPIIIKNGFYPSYSAMTFPFTITAVAVTNVSKLHSGILSDIVGILATILTIFATIMVSYVACKYIISMCTSTKTKENTVTKQ